MPRPTYTINKPEVDGDMSATAISLDESNSAAIATYNEVRRHACSCLASCVHAPAAAHRCGVFHVQAKVLLVTL